MVWLQGQSFTCLPLAPRPVLWPDGFFGVGPGGVAEEGEDLRSQLPGLAHPPALPVSVWESPLTLPAPDKGHSNSFLALGDLCYSALGQHTVEAWEWRGGLQQVGLASTAQVDQSLGFRGPSVSGQSPVSKCHRCAGRGYWPLCV